jgi:hypothetical protein
MISIVFARFEDLTVRRDPESLVASSSAETPILITRKRLTGRAAFIRVQQIVV